MATAKKRDIETRNNEPTLNRRLTAGGAESAGGVLDHRRLNSWGLDKRTTRYHTAAAWRNEIIAALGGLDEVSTTAQLTLVDLAMRTKMIMERLDRADAEPAPQEQILKDRRYLRARQQLDKELDREMGALGLKASDGFFRARSGNGTGQPAL